MPISLSRMQSTLGFQSNGPGYRYKRVITYPMQWLQEVIRKSKHSGRTPQPIGTLFSDLWWLLEESINMSTCEKLVGEFMKL